MHVDCPSRVVECPKCVMEVLSSSLNEHLAAYCLLGTVPCPLLCGASCVSRHHRT